VRHRALLVGSILLAACGDPAAAPTTVTIALPATSSTDLAFSGVSELPALTILSPLPGARVASPVQVEVEVTALDLTSDRIVVLVDGLPAGEFADLHFAVEMSPGRHTLEVRARRGDDDLGVVEAISVVVTA